jgi:prepilin-type processing-associated H-X9-DG protein
MGQSQVASWRHAMTAAGVLSEWNLQTLVCPAIRFASGTSLFQVGPAGANSGISTNSYGYNYFGYDQENYGLCGTVASLTPTREAEVTVPPDMIAFGDPLIGTLNSQVVPSVDSIARNDHIPYFGMSIGGEDPIVELSQLAAGIHDRRSNVLFCDGHIETLTFKGLFFDTADASLRRWNKDNETHRR